MTTAGIVGPEFDEVFIEPDLAFRAPPPGWADQLGPSAPASDRRRQLWDLLDRAEPIVLAIIGAPGSGKTSLLTQAARRTIKIFPERRRGVPVLLRLGDHANVVLGDPGITLAALVRQSIPDLLGDEPDGWWEGRLAEGSCIVLFDGLDEISSGAHRRDVLTWINDQISRYPRNDFVVASRRPSCRETFVRSATTLQLLAFNLDQVSRFVHGWYRAVERRATGGVGRGSERTAEERAGDLLDRLASSPALYELAINPLRLSMIAGLHRFGRPLPKSRTDLYSEVCQAPLRRPSETEGHDRDPHTTSKDDPHGAKVDADGRSEPGVGEERLLTALAFEMMRHGTGEIRRRQLLDSVATRLRRVPAEVTPEEFLAGVAAHGLLVERAGERYSFAHLALQEYLAARYIDQHGLESDLADAVDDPWWRETTLLYVAGAGPDRIIRAALHSGSVPALSLAFECSELGDEPAPELQRRLNEVLGTAFGDDSPADLRRLVAGVLAGRHLSKLATTPIGTRVCPEPVPVSLYRLFLKDNGAPPPDGTYPADSRRSDPIRGMWSRDAAAFVRWLNAVVGAAGTGNRRTEGILYRLPTGAELTGLADLQTQTARVRAVRVWCRTDGASGPTVWTRPGFPRGDVVPADELRECAAADLRGSTVVGALMVRAADRAVRRLGATSDPIRRESRILAETLESGRSGYRAGDLERHMVSALEMMGGLLGHLREARRAAVLLDGALRSVETIDAGTAHALDRAIAAYPIDQALADLLRVSSMEHDLAVSLDWSRDLNISAAAQIAQTVARRVGAAQRRLRKILATAPGPPRRSALEQQLALDLPIGAGREAEILRATVSAVLLPQAAENNREAVGRFAAEVLRLAMPAGSEAIPVDLDRVAAQVRHLAPAEPDRAAERRTPTEPGPPPWVAEVTRRLVIAARPVLDRQRPITVADVRAIRVPALLLAGEAEICRQPRRAAALRELAAAVCLMSRRASDPELLETLIVAAT